jgi:hypothetical protein
LIELIILPPGDAWALWLPDPVASEELLGIARLRFLPFSSPA